MLSTQKKPILGVAFLVECDLHSIKTRLVRVIRSLEQDVMFTLSLNNQCNETVDFHACFCYYNKHSSPNATGVTI